MLALFVSLALADVAPPDDYVETCTIAIQCGDIEGKTCESAMNQEDQMADCRPLMDEGWVQMCSAWGGTFSDVVFCKEQPDDAARKERIAKAKAPASSSWACVTAPISATLGFGLVTLAIRRRPG